MIKEEEFSDEEELTVLLGNFAGHLYSFIEERGLMSEFAKWMIESKNEAIIDLIRFGSVGKRLTEEAEATTVNLPVTGITDKMLDEEPEEEYTLNDVKRADG